MRLVALKSFWNFIIFFRLFLKISRFSGVNLRLFCEGGGEEKKYFLLEVGLKSNTSFKNVREKVEYLLHFTWKDLKKAGLRSKKCLARGKFRLLGTTCLIIDKNTF